MKQTCLEKYGVDNAFKSEEKKNKIKQSTKAKYGTENNMQSERGKEEFKQSMLKKYGVEYAQQNIEIHKKQQKSARKLNYFNDTNIYYRGSYELDFLEKYHDKLDIINALTIKYMFENKQHYYFPDFYIPSLNLIVEIKNDHLAKYDKLKIEAKKKATIANGFNYIMIVDRDYSLFESFLTNHGTSNL
jgi:hypothetical protein